MESFHYLSMSNHMMIQKQLMEQLKPYGLTLGQPKVLDYLKDHDGANQKEIAAACHIEAGSLTSVSHGRSEHGGTPNIKWKPQIISCVSHKKRTQAAADR